MINIYNTIFKGQLFLEKNRHYFVFEQDGLEVPVVVNNKFNYWLIKNKIDVSYPRLYQGQIRTYRFPYLEINELRNLDLTDSVPAPETFCVEGCIFKVYKNCIDKFEAEYNFLLINVGYEPYRFPLKVCFSRLDNYSLINRRLRLELKRVGYNLVLQSYVPLDIDNKITYGVL